MLVERQQQRQQPTYCRRAYKICVSSTPQSAQIDTDYADCGMLSRPLRANGVVIRVARPVRRVR